MSSVHTYCTQQTRGANARDDIAFNTRNRHSEVRKSSVHLAHSDLDEIACNTLPYNSVPMGLPPHGGSQGLGGDGGGHGVAYFWRSRRQSAPPWSAASRHSAPAAGRHARPPAHSRRCRRRPAARIGTAPSASRRPDDQLAHIAAPPLSRQAIDRGHGGRDRTARLYSDVGSERCSLFCAGAQQ